MTSGSNLGLTITINIYSIIFVVCWTNNYYLHIFAWQLQGNREYKNENASSFTFMNLQLVGELG